MTKGLDKNGDRINRGRSTGVRAERAPATSEFVNYELDKEQTAEYRAWRQDSDLVFSILGEMLEGGYRVSLKWDDYSNSCAAFVIPLEGNENYGLLLTGRGGNPYRALSEAVYKHEIVFGRVWHVTAKSGSAPDDPEY